MPFVDLASFPNSRIKPRPATRVSFENNTEVGAGETIELRPELPERTALTIYNNDGTLANLIRYKRGDDTDIETEGFPLGGNRAIDLDGPQSVYVHNPNGTPIVISWDDSVG